MVVLANIPFLSEGIELINDLILSSKRELERLNDPIMMGVFGRTESGGG
jgi:hypothetical protein